MHLIRKIDGSDVRDRFRNIEVIVACDVTNPLLGLFHAYMLARLLVLQYYM